MGALCRIMDGVENGDGILVDKGICSEPIRTPDFDTLSYPYLNFFLLHISPI